jgi:hypothetical protein
MIRNSAVPNASVGSPLIGLGEKRYADEGGFLTSVTAATVQPLYSAKEPIGTPTASWSSRRHPTQVGSSIGVPLNDTIMHRWVSMRKPD